MELDKLKTKQVYIQLLVDASVKKSELLYSLIEITQQQEELIEQSAFEEDAFLETVSRKEELLKRLEELDHGFDQTFEHVREELVGNKYRYEAEIRTLQEHIAEISDRSVKLQAMELRNRAKLEALLTRKRKEIRRSMVSSRTAAAYYKTMSNQNEEQSFFYDKKK